MLLEHERYHGLGMDALATVCSWNTNVIVFAESVDSSCARPVEECGKSDCRMTPAQG